MQLKEAWSKFIRKKTHRIQNNKIEVEQLFETQR